MNTPEDSFPTDFVAAHKLLQQLQAEFDRTCFFRMPNGDARAVHFAQRRALAHRIIRLRRHIFDMQQASPVLHMDSHDMAGVAAVNQTGPNYSHLDRAALLAQLAEKNPRVAELIAAK
jgi:hypothetical protein